MVYRIGTESPAKRASACGLLQGILQNDSFLLGNVPESQYLCAPIKFFHPSNFHPIVMEVRNYETVFIVTPVLNESQVQETVEKFTQVLKENSAAILSTEAWGLRKLAYPIQKKTTGYYYCLSFTGEGNIVDVLELAFRRDERIIRFLSTVLDKHAVDYNNRRRNGEMNLQKAAKEPEAVAQ